MASINVFARWRPPATSRVSPDTTTHSHSCAQEDLLSITISPKSKSQSAAHKPWVSPPAFTAVFEPEFDNAAVYGRIVAPALPLVLHGGSCSFFAYGHSGSGKTHTVVGYDFDDTKQLGLCLAAARELFRSLEGLNAGENIPENKKLGIGFSLFELRRKFACDLLNNSTECHIREGPDGKTHIRSETEVLPGGKVRVRPIVKRPCWTFGNLRDQLVQALGRRQVGSSSVHDESSRTHAVLELEIVNQELVDARQAVIERQSELVPVGKRATDVAIEEQTKGFVRSPEGSWVPNPDYEVNQARIDAAETEKAEYERRVSDAEALVESVLTKGDVECLGGKMVFVDLAGAEYHQEKGGRATSVIPNQTPQERQEGRQINSDLLALKEVLSLIHI